MQFHYEAFTFEGKKVGIIRIDQQPRPSYLKRDYGKLQREKVYVRRGSSTDPAKPASLEEVTKMGQSYVPDQAELMTEFASLDTDEARGTSISLQAEFCEMPSKKEIPVYQEKAFGIDFSHLVVGQTNSFYLKQLADFEAAKRLFRAVRIVVQNTGLVVAADVRVELTTPVVHDFKVLRSSEMPKPPQRRHSLIPAALNRIHAELKRPGDVLIREDKKAATIEIDCGNLQPQRRVWSSVFYLGRPRSGSVEFAGRALAENLAQPARFTLSVAMDVTRTRMSVEQLRALPEPGA